MSDLHAYNAAKAGNIEEIKSLLNDGFDINRKLDAIYSPTILHCAAMNNQLELVKFLIKRGADLNPVDESYMTPLDDAVNYSYPFVALVLHENGARLRKYPEERLKRLLVESQLELPSPDEIILTRPLADRFLTEVFNFKTQEYFCMVRKNADGPVECLNQMMFPQVKNRARLREAFDEYKKCGGAGDERILTVLRDDRAKQPLKLARG